MKELSSMADMATLIREENERLFGPQVEEIEGYIKEYRDGKIIASEALQAIVLTLGL